MTDPQYPPGPYIARPASIKTLVGYEIFAADPTVLIGHVPNIDRPARGSGEAVALLFAAAPETAAARDRLQKLNRDYATELRLAADARRLGAAERDRLREVNAELLAALNSISGIGLTDDGPVSPAYLNAAVRTARAAIAEAEKEPNP